MMTPAVKIFFILTLTLCFSAVTDSSPNLMFLNMAEESIDDDFKDFNHGYERWSVLDLLEKEMLSHKVLKDAWDRYKTIKEPETIALKIYTNNTNNIYYELNSAMRSGRTKYDSFGFKALHYLITHGIQQRNGGKKCMDVVRRSKHLYVPKGLLVRGGSFFSTSLKPNLLEYGNTSCLKIHTCHGANLTELSVYPYEAEVLIPPYEIFKVIAFETKKMDCELLFSLESAGTFSQMKGDIGKYLKPMAKLRK